MDESESVMAFLAILGVTETLCGFRLVLEEKAGKRIPGPSRLDISEYVHFTASIQYQRNTC